MPHSIALEARTVGFVYGEAVDALDRAAAQAADDALDAERGWELLRDLDARRERGEENDK